jgi:hypothetical protein
VSDLAIAGIPWYATAMAIVSLFGGVISALVMTETLVIDWQKLKAGRKAVVSKTKTMLTRSKGTP